MLLRCVMYCSLTDVYTQNYHILQLNLNCINLWPTATIKYHMGLRLLPISKDDVNSNPTRHQTDLTHTARMHQSKACQHTTTATTPHTMMAWGRHNALHQENPYYLYYIISLEIVRLVTYCHNVLLYIMYYVVVSPTRLVLLLVLIKIQQWNMCFLWNT